MPTPSDTRKKPHSYLNFSFSTLSWPELGDSIIDVHFPAEHRMMAQGPEASLKATQGLPLSSCIFSEGRRPLRMGSNHVTMSEST